MRMRPPLTRLARHLAALALGLLFAGPALAAPLTLTNINGTSMTVDDVNGSLYDYNYAGQDQLFQNHWYYRTGSMTAEDQFIGFGSTEVTSVVSNGLDTVTVSGTTPEFDFVVQYLLRNNDHIEQSFSLTSTSGALDVAVFSYYDFDVAGTAGGDWVSWDGNRTMTVSQGNPATSSTVIAILAADRPDLVEVSPYQALRLALRDGGVDDLNTAATSTTSLNNADITFAMQWNFVNVTDVAISTLVPEAPPVLMMAPALLGLAWLGRRRAAPDRR